MNNRILFYFILTMIVIIFLGWGIGCYCLWENDQVMTIGWVSMISCALIASLLYALNKVKV